MALAAVTSLAQIFDQMLQHQYVILPKRKLAKSLLKEVNSIQYILEATSRKSSEEINSLKSQITNAAYSEKHFIDSHIRKQIPSDLKYRKEKEISIRFSSQFLKKVRARINLLKRLAVMIERSRLRLPRRSSSSTAAGLLEGGHPPASADIHVVGLHDDFSEVWNWLVRGSEKLQIISVVGLGGIGKTTLATKVYKDLKALSHFDVQAWVTVSQSYNLHTILIDILDSMKILTEEMSRESDVQKLKGYLYQKLIGRRYLIVMDDVWDSTFWQDLKLIFPNNNNSSRVLLTTRHKNVAVSIDSSSHLLHMHLLDEDKSWNLFCHKVFGEDDSPLELKEIGKKMVQSCGGLPLTIIVMAGVLSKAPRKQDYWRSVAENLSSQIISYDKKLSKMLNLSYKHLPHHLKMCFLYIGIFPEDFRIPVSRLVNLWIAEGFIKHKDSKSLEDMAYSYLLDLIDRSLITVDKSSLGKIKACKIHDLVRDFCARKAKNDMNFHIVDKSLYGVSVQAAVDLLIVHPNKTNVFPCDEKKLSSLLPLVRSLVTFDPDFEISKSRQLQHSERLIVVDTEGRFPIDNHGEENGLYFYNLRYLACEYEEFDRFYDVFPRTSSSRFWYLQTLILQRDHWSKSIIFDAGIVVEIWNMPNLRHVRVDKLTIPHPWSFTVLENLQSLSEAYNFTCSKEVIRRIPNLKELELSTLDIFDSKEDYCLNNLIGLSKLEAFRFSALARLSFREYNITFPPSLRYLKLTHSHLASEDMHIIGCLPNLQVLKLRFVEFSESMWEPVEGEFLNLKYLKIVEVTTLETWDADSSHFPSLERLSISSCNLNKIPSDIGNIPSLQLIELRNCSRSLVSSVKEMQEEQRELGYDVIPIRISSILTGEDCILK